MNTNSPRSRAVGTVKKLEQFTMNSRCAPAQIAFSHRLHQFSNISMGPRPAGILMPGYVGPVLSETVPVPGQHPFPVGQSPKPTSNPSRLSAGRPKTIGRLIEFWDGRPSSERSPTVGVERGFPDRLVHDRPAPEGSSEIDGELRST